MKEVDEGGGADIAVAVCIAEFLYCDSYKPDGLMGWDRVGCYGNGVHPPSCIGDWLLFVRQCS
jgi:hypothetical protein